MVVVRWGDTEIVGNYAVKGRDFVEVLDEAFQSVGGIRNIRPEVWEAITLEGGDWMEPWEVPTEAERLRAEVDFQSMELEAAQNERDVLRADVDFVLMLLEGGA